SDLGGQGQAQRGSQVDDLSAGAGSSMLHLHLDGVPGTRVPAEITPVEPEPVSTGVGIEMRTPCRRRPCGRPSVPLRFPVRPLQRSERKSTRLNSSHVKISYAVF